MGGYVFVFKRALVSWSSQRIKCASLSSTESEYVAATDAGKEGQRIRFLLAQFKLLDAGKPTILRVDNKSAITVAEGLGLTGNLKHMERHYAWLQHMMRRGKFVLKYILTTVQPADFLTKVLHFPVFNRCSVCRDSLYNGSELDYGGWHELLGVILALHSSSVLAQSRKKSARVSTSKVGIP
ncbi:unnamed protein product [Closterium sp. NIES-54]